MAEPFKNLFSRALINAMAEHFAKHEPSFDARGFAAMAAQDLEALEFKARSDQIAQALAAFLPSDFKKATALMLATLAPEDECDVNATRLDECGVTGWATLPMTYYVGHHGRDHFDLSMQLLKELTKRGSSEFGIRFFLHDEPERTLTVLKTWAHDPNLHVRRLVSEGTRPRLPWAMRLPKFIDRPAPIVPLLEILKDDEKDYVRRSVANNLNDIAKDHPDLVARIAKHWLKGASKERSRLIRHACRTLIKQGHPATLKVLGYGPPAVKLEKLKILTPRVPFGDALTFTLSITSTANHIQPLILDYAIHHRKANGKTRPKVFKWKEIKFQPNASLTFKRRHPIKKITTRTYHEGRHRLEILVNGTSIGSGEFELVM